MPFEVPELEYGFDALEPHIDAKTMEIHHDKHHAAYVAKLNDAVAGTEFENMEIGDILRNIGDVPESIRTAVRNNGGGHANHTLFWETLKPGGPEDIVDPLKHAIVSQWGTIDAWKKELEQAGATRFGSGWAWLVMDKDGKLKVLSTANQDSPLMDGMTPILGVDVWEHAYYLNYQNRRPDYLAAIWKVINWDVVGKKYQEALERVK
ncbi:MAG: Superoxide dismutase [Mn] [Chlamydiia bacterium]|nr:Superoxide dismutase [Mn] [Chlamydiia bacterium]